MLCNFRKTFFPTEEEIKEQREWIKNNSLPKKSDIELIKENRILYCSEGLRDFEEECNRCKNFIPYGENVTIDEGVCKLYKCNCGHGYTCDDYCR